jgi:hypothetical protein
VVEDLVADDAGHFEALFRGYRVDDHVAMDADEVFRIEDAVFILCSSEIVSRRVLKQCSSAKNNQIIATCSNPNGERS